MRYDDASQAGSMANDSAPVARPDVDALAPGSFGPASGNAITGAGTTTGASGEDTVGTAPAHIVAVQGAGGEAANANGNFQASGQYGVLSMDAEGNFNYVRNAGTPDGVQDVFNYTLADADGQTSSTTLTIDIAKGGTGQAAVIPGTAPVIPGVVNLPAGVQMSDIHVRGSDLVIDMPDGTQMVIPNGAVFVPQLVIGDVQLPPSNLAALFVDSEGPLTGANGLQSSGGNFDVPVPPLDPGVPLGDLIPPTELSFPQPEFVPEGQFIDKKPVAGDVAVQLDDDDIPGRGGNPGGPNDDAGSPNATASGNLPGSDGDAPISWGVAGITLPSTGGFSVVAGPGGSILVQQAQTGGTVTVLTITVDAATGAFTVVENNPIVHPADNNTEGNVSFVVNYTVTDADGDVANGTLTVNVDDDTPTVTVQAGPDAEVILTTHDALSVPGDGTPDSDSTTANFSNVFGGSTISAGADGAGPGTSSTYVLAVTAQNSGLTSHGAVINLFMVGGVVVGTTAASAPANLSDSAIVFTISTTNTGEVTLTQLLQIDHPIAQDPSATGAPFDDQVISMADGLVTLTRNITVVDNDGDQVTGSASVNIGANLHFTDDGPTIGLADRGEPQLVVDDSDFSTNATGSFAANFAADFGADGPAAAGGGLTYALGINAGVTGLVDTLSGQAVVLSVVNGQVVGTAGVGGPTVFVVSVDAAGVVTLDQQRAVVHNDPNDPVESGGSAATFNADNLITLTATATDFDGDTASRTIGIAQDLHFEDDGPSVSPTLNANATVTVDESLPSNTPGIDTGGIVKGDDPDLSGGIAIGQSNSGSAIVDPHAAFGNDGPAASNSITYALSILNASSGLTLTDGTPINLQLVNGVIVGVVNGGTFNGQAAFAIAINSTTGVVTVEQYLSLDHPVNPDPNDPLHFGSSVIGVTVTATDGDGDHVTSPAVDIGGQLTFLDDGPSVAPTLNVNATVTVDETLPSNTPAINTGSIVKGDDPDLAGGLAIGQANSGSAIVDPHAIFGADGPAAGGGIAYALSILNVSSGLTLTDGTPINLQLVNGVIVGVVNGGTFNGQAAFAIAINSTTGVVSVEQYLSLDHPVNPNPNDPLSIGSNIVGVTVTATDGDGDPVTSPAVDIGGQITFLDDGPTVDPTLNVNSTVTVDESLPSNTPAINTGSIVKGDDPDLAGGIAIGQANSGSAIVDPHAIFGADGPAASNSITYALSITNAASGLTLTDGTPINLQLVNGVIVGVVNGGTFNGQAAFAIAINSTTGVVSVEQYLSLDHPVNPDPNDPLHFGSNIIGVTVTATDGDGDPVTSPAVDIGGQITFLDDGPTANADVDSTGGVGTTATGNVLTGVDHTGGDANTTDGVADVGGADGRGSITNLVGFGGSTDSNPTGGFNVNGQYGTLHMDANGDYTYTRTGGPGGAIETFTYTFIDGDGDPVSTTLTITLGDAAPVATTAAATVDDDGLAGANTAAAGTGGDIDANVGESPASASEAVYNGLLGSSSAGDGPATFLFLASLNGTTATVGTETVTYSLSGAVTGGFTTLTATGPRGVLFTVTITDQSTGAYTVTLVDNVLHPTLNGLSGDDGENGTSTFVVVPYQMRDSDGDNSASPGQLTITFNDDVPVANNDSDTVVAGTLGPATGNVLTGVDHSGPDANSTDGVADSFGADGPSSPAIIGLVSVNVPGNPDTDGSLNFSVAGQYGFLTLNTNGDYTYTRNAGTPGGVNDVFTYTIQDADGDKTTATITIHIDDATPTAVDGVAAVDDDGLVPFGNNDNATGDLNANAGEAAVVNPSEAIFHGQLVGTGGDTITNYSFAGMNGTSGTVGTENVSYSWNNATSTLTATISSGARTGTELFHVVVNQATGSYNLTLVNNVLHADEVANQENDATTSLTFTVTDTDGDHDDGTIVVTFDDDMPVIHTVTDPLDIANTGTTPSGTGSFDFDVGADQNSSHDDISVSGFTVTVNGSPATNVHLVAGTEDATTAHYTFDFQYDTGSGGTATATGTLDFNKGAGTYTVTMTSGPIEGFSILSTGTADAGDFVSYQVPSGGSGAPEVTVAALDTDFFVQFSGVAEPGSGTGSDNLFTTTGTANNFDPVTTTNYAGLELFTQAMGTVQVSSTAAGTNGNTIQGGEVLDFNLYNTDPAGTLGGVPTAQSDSMFIQLDGIGGSEDMIVVLKLLDTSTGQYTTKALMVQNGDIITDNADLAGTAYSSIVLDNNDGLIVIEPNDYQEGNSHLVIVGAQIAGSDEGIVGTAINLNGDIGGASSGTQLFSTDVSDAPFKITSIGFVTPSTTDQSATIEFDVTVTDSDGDQVTQNDVTVNIGTPVSPLLAQSTLSTKSSVSTMDSLQTTTNSNAILMGAFAAAGLTASEPLAAHDFSNQSLANHSLDVTALHTTSLTPVAVSGVEGAHSFDLGTMVYSGHVAGPALTSSFHATDNGQAAAILDSAGSHSDVMALSSLSQGTNMPVNAGHAAAATLTAAGVAMPDAALLLAAAAAHGGVSGQAASIGAQHNQVVAQVLADALHGGQAGPNLEALVTAVTGGSHAGPAVGDALASHGGGTVPIGDMAIFTGFTGMHSLAMMEQMAVHADAAPAHA